MNKIIEKELREKGAEFVFFVDISTLSEKENRDYPAAIVFGTPFSKEYLRKVSATDDYVKTIIDEELIHEDEFSILEAKTDRIADELTELLRQKGHTAFSQSEESILQAGIFDAKNRISPLPHKTLAGLAGFGWIGKHNLLVTKKYGSALSMCSVLTDAPLETDNHSPMESHCGTCTVCEDICKPEAIKGKIWTSNTSRDEIVDVFKCTTCLECLIFCPWTQKYMKGVE